MTEKSSEYNIGSVESGAIVVQGDNNSITSIQNASFHNITPELIAEALKLTAQSQSPSKPSLQMMATDSQDPEDPLNAKIGEIIKLVGDGFVSAARKAYERLWDTDAPNASPRSRHRLRANIGQVYLLLNEKQKAITEFQLAYQEAPELPMAQASLATALLLQGETTKAFEYAQKVLEQDKTNLQAACVILDTAPEQLSSTAVKDLLPAELHSKKEVLLGLSTRASISGEAKEAETYARAALRSAPHDWHALAVLAIALLAPLSDLIGVRYTHSIPKDFERKFDEGLRLLRRSWSIVRKRDDAIHGAYVAANLVSTLDLADQPAEAERVLAEAIEIAPNEPHIIREVVNRCVIRNDWPEVLRWLDKISPEDKLPADQLVAFQARIETGDAERVLIEAEEFQRSIDDIRLIEMSGAARIDAAAMLNKLNTCLDEVLEKSPNSIILRSIAISRLPDHDSKIPILLDEIAALADQTKDPRERLFAADAFLQREHFGKAADLYQTVDNTIRSRPVLQKHLTALHFADRRADARFLFEKLDSKLQLVPEFGRLGVIIYERSGLLKEARKLLEQLLKAHGNLEDRIYWIKLLERLGEVAPIRQYLATVKQEQSGSPRELIVLAQAIDKYVGGAQSLPIAYRALRDGFDDQQVHLGYAFGLFIMGNVHRYLSNTPTEVGNDTAVVLNDVETGLEISRILETLTPPKLELHEISVSDPFSQMLIGKTVGDILEIPNIAIGVKRYIVKEIHNKYLFAHIRTLQQFGSLFPASQAMASLDVGPSPGVESFQPIIDVAKRRYDAGKFVFDTYKATPIPIGMISKFLSISPLDAIMTLLYQDRTVLRCSVGDAVEFSKARDAIAQATRTIIDPVTLFVLVKLGVASAIKEMCPNLSIVQTSVDMLQQFANEHEHKASRGGGTLGWDGTQLHMTRFSDGGFSEIAGLARDALVFAKSLDIVPAEGKRPISAGGREILEELHPAFLDSVLASQKDGSIFLTDDLTLRLLAEEAAGIKGVWTQAIVRVSFGHKKCSGELLNTITCKLEAAGFCFLSVSSGDILEELSANNWELTDTLSSLTRLLSRTTNLLPSVIHVLAEVIFRSWSEKPSPTHFSILIRFLLLEFKKQHTSDLCVTIFAAAYRLTYASVLRDNRRARFNNALQATTCHTGMSFLIEKIDEAKLPMMNEIFRVISSQIEELRIGRSVDLRNQ